MCINNNVTILLHPNGEEKTSETRDFEWFKINWTV